MDDQSRFASPFSMVAKLSHTRHHLKELVGRNELSLVAWLKVEKTNVLIHAYEVNKLESL